MIKYLVVATILTFAVLPVVAQELPPVGTDNMSHKHDFMGTIDGCRMWHIEYWGRDVFMARCPGSTAADMSHEESCGKSCTETLQTVGARSDTCELPVPGTQPSC